jgi:hypothetical protein
MSVDIAMMQGLGEFGKFLTVTLMPFEAIAWGQGKCRGISD